MDPPWTWEQQEVQRHAPHRAARLGTELRAGGAAAAEARLGAQRLGPRAPKVGGHQGEDLGEF